MPKRPALPPKLRDKRVEALRSALIEGERSGAPMPFDMDAFIAEKRAERGA